MDPYKYRPSSAYNSPFWTTNSGAPVWNNNSSLTVGPRGPILLEDYHLVEKLANFDRERIPERVVHARGASAKGFFETTHDISNLTCADFLRAPGVQTPVILRFSTVIHERGSPETLRDPRGFAVKFYTREGNFDLVGNNFPVFFIRDGMKFPDMVHALKPNPKSHIQENWRIVDFFSHHPESLHMFSFLFDDVGIPQDYRHMEGSGVNTYTLINKAGKAHYVKFHWKPTCGVKCLLEEEAIRVGGSNHSHATQDLYDSIAAGNYPEWKLFIQTIDPDHEDKFDFDPLDVTKTWPEDILPLQPVGRLVLNRNIDNFFAENEQLAFCPAIVVPGVYYSDDKLLQTRIFSYSDTQRHRLGPNYLQLPANAPKCAHHNNHHEGFMNFMHRDEEVNYFPSRYDPVRHAERYPIPPAILTGRREKCIIPKENNFKQPGERYRSFAPDRQERFIQRWVDALSDPRVTYEIRSIWISYWSQVRPLSLAKFLEPFSSNITPSVSNQVLMSLLQTSG
ncbi:catalase isozyme 1 isoform X1 [Vitis vinifera]|uniref:catalase isozyme 1 isoform X1 n=1 Tax=Vitis vinifera TaxID=29760 RepID=UPI00288309BE|nr:catalase isozyme 1 isoform X1 [Vitis vinifera]